MNFFFNADFLLANSKICFLGKCTLNFGGRYKEISKLYLLGFDLTNSGTVKIKIPQPSPWSYNCAVNEVAQMSSNGYEITSSQTFGTRSVNGMPKTFRLTVSKEFGDRDFSSIEITNL